MKVKRELSAEEIVRAVARIEASVAAGASVANACRLAGVSSQTYYRNRATPTRDLKKRREAAHVVNGTTAKGVVLREPRGNST